MKPTRNLNECSEIIRARGGSEPEPARQVTRPRVAEEQGPGCLHADGTSGWCPHSGDRAVLLESHRHLDTWPGTKEVDRGLSPERNTGKGPGDFQHENQGSEPARPDPTYDPSRPPHPPPAPCVPFPWLAGCTSAASSTGRPAEAPSLSATPWAPSIWMPSQTPHTCPSGWTLVPRHLLEASPRQSPTEQLPRDGAQAGGRE